MKLDKLRRAFGGADIIVKAEYDACRPVKLTGGRPFIESAGNDPVECFGKLRVSVLINGKKAAWAAITLIKPFAALPSSIAVRRVALLSEMPMTSEIDIGMVETAIELDAKVAGRLYSIDGAAPLIIADKVFVEHNARRCGVSEYLHENVTDIVHYFTGCRPTLAVLNCGDFAEEAKGQGLSGEDYKEMLYAHYIKCGYATAFGAAKSVVSKYVMWRQLR